MSVVTDLLVVLHGVLTGFIDLILFIIQKWNNNRIWRAKRDFRARSVCSFCVLHQLWLNLHWLHAVNHLVWHYSCPSVWPFPVYTSSFTAPWKTKPKKRSTRQKWREQTHDYDRIWFVCDFHAIWSIFIWIKNVFSIHAKQV